MLCEATAFPFIKSEDFESFELWHHCVFFELNENCFLNFVFFQCSFPESGSFIPTWTFEVASIKVYPFLKKKKTTDTLNYCVSLCTTITSKWNTTLSFFYDSWRTLVTRFLFVITDPMGSVLFDFGQKLPRTFSFSGVGSHFSQTCVIRADFLTGLLLVKALQKKSCTDWPAKRKSIRSIPDIQAEDGQDI